MGKDGGCDEHAAQHEKEYVHDNVHAKADQRLK